MELYEIMCVKLLKIVKHWQESYDKPRQCVKKQRYHFADKDPSSQPMIFPVVMYGCESCTIRKAEHQRIN